MAYIAKTDGTKEELARVPSLAQAQRIVGGYVERLRCIENKDIILLCNEDGKLTGLPLNHHGCMLYGPCADIVGDIIVVDRKEPGARKWM